MPTLNNPSERARIPVPLTGVSSRQPITTGDKILNANIPAASTGNTTEDHIEELLARSGHSAATAYATETQYAVGDEVYWRDGDGRLQLYIRLVAGQDPSGSNPSTLTTQWRRVINSLNDIPVDGDASRPSLLEKGGEHGAVRGSVALYDRLAVAQSAAQVSTAIDLAITALLDQSLWRGEWRSSANFQTGQYVYRTVSNVDRYYRRLTDGTTSGQPNADSTNWVEVTGTERLSASVSGTSPSSCATKLI